MPNVEIWVEVHGNGTAHPPHIKTIMEHCGQPNVGVTWNSNRPTLRVAPWPSISSCSGRGSARATSTSCTRICDGEYPYRELFRLFRETGYDRVTLVEVARSMPDVDSAEELLRYYKALWTELTRG